MNPSRGESAGELAAHVIDRLRRLDMSLAVAESLTGGGIAASLTAISGASDVLVGGVVAYTNGAKAHVLGVDRDLLATRGPVDVQVAQQMAQGVLRLMSADVAVSTTGVAGPGPHDGHAAGTFWVGSAIDERFAEQVQDTTGVPVSISEPTVVSEPTAVLFNAPGSRSKVQDAAVRAGLNRILAVSKPLASR